MKPKTYTTTEAAPLLKVKPATVRQLIRRGLLKSKILGRDHYISESEIERYNRERVSPGGYRRKER